MIEDRDRALSFLLARAIGQHEAAELARELSAHTKERRDEPDHIAKQLLLTKKLYTAGRITPEERVLFVSFIAERLHDQRWMGGFYDRELVPLQQKMEALERKYELPEGHYWKKADAPEDYAVLSNEYERRLDDEFVKVLRELGEEELADLRQTAPSVYDGMRETARLHAFEPNNKVKALKELINSYEAEAEACAAGRAHLSACVMLGSAAEARLLLKILENGSDASVAKDRLVGKAKPRGLEPLNWSFKDLIVVASEAGWLRAFDERNVGYDVRGLTDLVRIRRNLVHPGRYVVERPFLKIGCEIYDEIRACYQLLRDSLIELNQSEPNP